jgi:hypothetical protein
MDLTPGTCDIFGGYFFVQSLQGNNKHLITPESGICRGEMGKLFVKGKKKYNNGE